MGYLIIFLISMIPIVELRGAIPVAVGMQLNMFWAYVICIVGNMLPVPFIFFFARKVLLWGKDKKFIGKFFTFCIEKGEKGGKKLQAKAGRGLFIALCCGYARRNYRRYYHGACKHGRIRRNQRIVRSKRLSYLRQLWLPCFLGDFCETYL